MKAIGTIALGATVLLSATAAQAGFGDTLKTVKERGALSCSGHNGTYLGMAEVDDKGNWKGFDIDMCRAVASAIFGTPEGHLKIQSTSWEQRWPSLQSGELDLVIKSSGWTMSRDTDTALQFSRPYIMAAISYATHAENNAQSIKDIDGGTLCVQSGTTLERYATDHAASNGYELEVVPFDSTEAAKAAFLSGRCDAYVEWDLQIAVMRATEVENPESIAILPDVLSAEPVAIVMRQGDDQWIDVANWVGSILIQADEAGVTSANVDEMKANPPTPAIATMLGVTPGVGKRLDLSDDWAYNVIKNVGNYNEIWERNLGEGSAYKLARGVNGLIRNGGIMYSLTMD
ncbi:transporter substrate-binding domain-containing protein [Hoeflea alexandrii]|uniref:transporter substrate-binding domain-containing protein n=1 Tax=Hoeflea alexandrii TaxID=288436 RepID=UPI0022AFEC87|nr:transporter substrate-binding domain-containing protein [Hoeflea alexandrii]MCZ4291633.1 transporter substrate-binding domain-containing protein [Hoeflea alexandrii]